MSEKWSKEFDSCFQVGSIEEIADALEKRSGSEENALAMLAMTAFTLMTRRGICEMQNVAPDGKGIRLELIGLQGKMKQYPDTTSFEEVKGAIEVSLRNKAAAENLPSVLPVNV